MRWKQSQGPMLASICLGAGLGEANHNFGWSLFWILFGLAFFALDVYQTLKVNGGRWL